jgi:hypothetical protein
MRRSVLLIFFECTPWLFAGQPVDRFRNEEINQRYADGSHYGAKDEHGPPVMRLEQPGGDRTTEHDTDRVADDHQGDAEVFTPRARKFGCRCIDCREHSANAETGQNAPERQFNQA